MEMGWSSLGVSRHITGKDIQARRWRVWQGWRSTQGFRLQFCQGLLSPYCPALRFAHLDAWLQMGQGCSDTPDVTGVTEGGRSVACN